MIKIHVNHVEHCLLLSEMGLPYPKPRVCHSSVQARTPARTVDSQRDGGRLASSTAHMQGTVFLLGAVSDRRRSGHVSSRSTARVSTSDKQNSICVYRTSRTLGTTY